MARVGDASDPTANSLSPPDIFICIRAIYAVLIQSTDAVLADQMIKPVGKLQLSCQLTNPHNPISSWIRYPE